MKFSIKDLETADLVTFAEEILNGKLYYLCRLFHDKISIYLLNTVTLFNVILTEEPAPMNA